MNVNQCQFPRLYLANPYFCVKDPQSHIIDFVVNLELLAEKIKAEKRSKFQEIEINSKSSYTRFSASLMKKAVSTRAKQESKKTYVSRMRKKQTHPLTFSGFKKLNWLI